MTTYLPAIRVAVDAGMAVLILLVQLIIYPSFHAVAEDTFSSWHRRYVGLIGTIVIPLMFIQAGCIVLQLLTSMDWTIILSAAAVLGAWAVTFTISAPCHQKLQRTGKNSEIITLLIRTNWLRTVCWVIAFAAGFLGLLYQA
jgi:hypothetical protein